MSNSIKVLVYSLAGDQLGKVTQYERAVRQFIFIFIFFLTTPLKVKWALLVGHSLQASPRLLVVQNKLYSRCSLKILLCFFPQSPSKVFQPETYLLFIWEKSELNSFGEWYHPLKLNSVTGQVDTHCVYTSRIENKKLLIFFEYIFLRGYRK